jgi:transcriptional regulator with XRE-family HTH domain
VPTANDQLRQARERTESPTYPGECLSRQELAELVNAHIWRHHQKTVEIDANYVGKLERGDIRWPSALYREALRTVLGVSTDAALGFRNRRRTVVRLEDVDRKQFLRATALGALSLAPLTGGASALLDGIAPTPVPARIGRTEIEHIHSAARVFTGWDHTYGGGLARETVLAQLRYSSRLLEASVPTRLRAELFGAVGHLGDVAGFMAFDACAHDDAKRVFRFALACAEEAGDWHLRASILSNMARQAIFLGRSDEGLTYCDYALVRADRLTPTERAMLHNVRAHALAKMRRVRDTLVAIGTADDHFAGAAPANDPQWMSYFDTAQHLGDTGHALVTLASTGHGAAEASRRLSAAISGHNTARVRSTVRCEVLLASLTMITGDPTQAATTGTAALDHAGNLRSPRTLALLRELRQRATAHKSVGEVEHLRRRIDTVLVAS